MLRSLLKPIAVICTLLLVFAFILVLTQDLQIFPGALRALIAPEEVEPKTFDQRFERIWIHTADGEKLDVWHLPASLPLVNHKVALVFHGNSGGLQNFRKIQLWFSSFGVESYAVDYRGFGLSSGWPSERGLYEDADALWRYVQGKGVAPEEVISFGISLGTAVAAELASKYQLGALLMLSPYTSLTDVVRALPGRSWLASFVWYEFPTARYVSELKVPCLIVAHGESDKLISFKHSQQLFSQYRGTGYSELILSKTSDHNSLFFDIQPQMESALKHCFSGNK